jgi:hypothetical protein
MQTNSGTYVYCVVKSDRRPTLGRAPSGVPGGGRPRAIEGAAGTWLVVSDVPLDAYGADSINSRLKDMEWVSARALAHEAVVEFCTRGCDVVPMKLFTIFKDDERARAQVGTTPTLRKLFRRIGGCAEWSVRLSCSPAAAVALAAERGKPRTRRARESGTSFLQRKKVQRDEARQAASVARGTVDRVFRRLDAIAKESVRKQSDLPGSTLVLDAAFLVPRRRRGTFEREVARLSSTTSTAGCDLVLSGPWPAYHFVGRD